MKRQSFKIKWLRKLHEGKVDQNKSPKATKKRLQIQFNLWSNKIKHLSHHRRLGGESTIYLNWPNGTNSTCYKSINRSCFIGEYHLCWLFPSVSYVWLNSIYTSSHPLFIVKYKFNNMNWHYNKVFYCSFVLL